MRSFDVVGAVVLALLFLPVLAGCALLVKVTSKGPVLHRSRRLAALSGRFDALKFRSMVVNGDAVLADHFAKDPDAQVEYEQDLKLADDPRVTAVGRWLRRRSLDELPQLWNVFRGEMSLVGPRPKLPDEHDLYGDAIDLVLSVKPGLTGLWQVSGRSSLSYEQRIALDVAYVRGRTLWGDIVICLRTAVQLLKANGDQAH